MVSTVLGLELVRRVHKRADLGAGAHPLLRDYVAEQLAQGRLVWLVREDGAERVVVTNSRNGLQL